MPEDPKIEAIISLHEWNVAKDKRIAELERRLETAESYRLNYEHATQIDHEDYDQRIAELEELLEFTKLERDNRTSAYEVGVKIIGDQKQRIAELERQLGRLAECGDWPLCDVRRVAREAIEAARKELG